MVEKEMDRMEKKVKAHNGLILLKMNDILETVSRKIEGMLRQRYFLREVEQSTASLDASAIFYCSGATNITTLSSGATNITTLSEVEKEAKKNHDAKMATVNSSLDSINEMKKMLAQCFFKSDISYRIKNFYPLMIIFFKVDRIQFLSSSKVENFFFGEGFFSVDEDFVEVS